VKTANKEDNDDGDDVDDVLTVLKACYSVPWKLFYHRDRQSWLVGSLTSLP